MSRIGKLPVSLPQGVSVSVENNVVKVKGPKGELTQKVDPDIEVSVERGVLTRLPLRFLRLRRVPTRYLF